MESRKLELARLKASSLAEVTIPGHHRNTKDTRLSQQIDIVGDLPPNPVVKESTSMLYSESDTTNLTGGRERSSLSTSTSWLQDQPHHRSHNVNTLPIVLQRNSHPSCYMVWRLPITHRSSVNKIFEAYLYE